MAIREFRLPDPGEGLVEADVVTWRVAVGDVVAINDVLLEIETSKSLVELPSPYAGTVAALLVPEGATVDVGTPIIQIEDGAAGPPGTPAAGEPPEQAAVAASVDPDEAGTAGAADGPTGGRVPVLVGYGARTGPSRRRARRTDPAAPAPHQAREQTARTFTTSDPVSRRPDDRAPLHPAPSGPTSDGPAPAVAPLPGPGAAAPEPVVTGGGVLAKPPVRKLAKDLGVDLATVAGSGPGGVVTRADVEAAAAPASPVPASPVPASPAPASPVPEPPAPAPLAAPTAAGDVRVPIRGVRKATAEAMVRSAFTAPHVTEWLTCDVTATLELVERVRARREFRDLRVTPLVVVAKAVCLALRRTPELNSAWDEAAGEIVLKSSVNLGIAAATPRGLVVPNLKDAQAMTLLELASALAELVTTAREGRTTPADMAGGTFTLTNVGTFGVDAGTPILNPGESGILAFGQVARRPWVVGTGADERIEPRWVTTLAVSFDHRLADGAQGSTFLADVAALLGDPGLALLY